MEEVQGLVWVASGVSAPGYDEKRLPPHCSCRSCDGRLCESLPLYSYTEELPNEPIKLVNYSDVWLWLQLYSFPNSFENVYYKTKYNGFEMTTWLQMRGKFFPVQYFIKYCLIKNVHPKNMVWKFYMEVNVHSELISVQPIVGRHFNLIFLRNNFWYWKQ